MLAYYYNWFDAKSWDRAKIDYPAAGRYSSDDPRVIRQQIRQAKSAGIDGFIVSWKSTPTNNRRLRVLMTIAGEEQFKLGDDLSGPGFRPTSPAGGAGRRGLPAVPRRLRRRSRHSSASTESR